MNRFIVVSAVIKTRIPPTQIMLVVPFFNIYKTVASKASKFWNFSIWCSVTNFSIRVSVLVLLSF
jgi:hypothetical protein